MCQEWEHQTWKGTNNTPLDIAEEVSEATSASMGPSWYTSAYRKILDV